MEWSCNRVNVALPASQTNKRSIVSVVIRAVEIEKELAQVSSSINFYFTSNSNFLGCNKSSFQECDQS